MILTFLYGKLKLLLFVFVNIFKRAFFCGKRSSNYDVIPLTHVISNNEEYLPEWGDWEEGSHNKESETIYDSKSSYINQQNQKPLENTDSDEQINFFNDMTPQITKQIKILVNNDDTNAKNISTNRLNLLEDNFTSELIEWQDNSGWERENLESDAQKLIREDKQLKRKQKVLQMQQKRQERTLNKGVNSKLTV